jgi:hypothetical protein
MARRIPVLMSRSDCATDLECYNGNRLLEEEQKMRRILLVGVLSLGLAVPGIAGVRGTEWGMSKLQVRGVEGKPKDEEKDRLVYEDRLGGLKTAVVYLFNDREELYSIRYDFHMDKKERIFFNPALKQFDSISKSTAPPPGVIYIQIGRKGLPISFRRNRSQRGGSEMRLRMWITHWSMRSLTVMC